MGLLSIPLILLLLKVVPYIFNFSSCLILIDNTEFGFPWWLALIIDSVSGCVAYFLTGILFDLFLSYDKKAMSTVKSVIGIIVGFAVGFIVNCLIKYWYIVLIIIGVAIICIALYYILRKKIKRS